MNLRKKYDICHTLELILKSGRIQKYKDSTQLSILDTIATGNCNKKDELEDRDEFGSNSTRELRLKKWIRKRNGDVIKNIKDIKLVSILCNGLQDDIVIVLTADMQPKKKKIGFIDRIPIFSE